MTKLQIKEQANPQTLRPRRIASLKIRAAKPDDAKLLASLETRCFNEAWSLRALKEALHDEKYCAFIAHCANAKGKYSTCGYVLGWSIEGEAELARVAVLPSHRGKGIARRLTTRILQEFVARGAQSAFLEVRPSNQAARKLYESCSFELVGKRRNYYEDGEAALVMRVALP